MAFTPISPLPTSPARNQQAAVFVSNMDAWIAALPTWTSQVNALAAVLDADAASAVAAAAAAAASASAAAASSSAVAWVSGTAYALNAVVVSQVNFLPYRCKLAVTGTTDPSADTTHWVLQTAQQPYQIGATVTAPMSANVTLTINSTKLQTVKPNANGLALTMPNATTLPTLGEIFAFRNATDNGGFPVAVNDSGGNLIGWVPPGAATPWYLESNASSTGNWRSMSGDRAMDSGIYWWGTSMTNRAVGPSTSLTSLLGSVTQSNFSAFGLNSGLVILGQPGTTLAVQPYTIRDGGSFYAASSALALTSAYMPATHDMCENGTWEVLYAYPTSTGATGPTVQSVAINSSTFVATSNVTRTGAAVTVGAIAIDNITSGLSVLVYTESTTNKAWIATVSGTGASTALNTATALSATTGMTNVWVAGLTSTLAHAMYTDNTNIYFNRVVLTTTTATPGAQISTAGANALSAANTPYAAESVAIDATHSLHVWVANSPDTNDVWATYVTDNGSVITQVSTKIASMNAQGYYGTLLQGAYKLPNAAILLQFADGVSRKFATVRMIGTTPVMGPMTDAPDTGTPLYRSTAFNNDLPPCSVKSVTGFTVFPTVNLVAASAAVTLAYQTRARPLLTA